MAPVDPLTEQVLAGFRRRYLEGAPFREDRDRASELAEEALPAVEDLLVAARGDQAVLSSLEHHEGLAMVTLLGRRAAGLGVTPTAALSVVPAILGGLAEAGHPLPESEESQLQALFMEGYVATRDERISEALAARAAAALRVIPVAPRCVALILSGEHDAEVLGEVVERFGRALLDRDAASSVVDLSTLEGPSPSRAAEVFNAHAAARMLGVGCVFSGASPAWIDAADRTGLDVSLFAIEPAFDRALARALEACGLAIRRKRGGLLRRMLGT